MAEETRFNLEWAGRLLRPKAAIIESFPNERNAGFNMNACDRSKWDHVESLKLRFCRDSYNNEFIDRDTLAYVFSPNTSVNSFVEQHLMGVKEKPVRVHIISAATNADYDAGFWYFYSSDENGTNRNGILVNAPRFILRRLAPEATTAPEVEEGEEGGEEAPPPKRLRIDGEEEEKTDRRYYKGHMYDSVLEARHARFLDSLGVAFEPHPGAAKINCIDPASGEVRKTEYNPDMRVDPHQVRHGGSTGTLYVEIKPCYPHMGELSKVEAFSKQAGCNILLLYGDFVKGGDGLPFSFEDAALNAGTGRHYLHTNGIRGMLFCGQESEFRRVDGVVWSIEENGGILIDALLHSGDKRWRHERLVAAYAAAAVKI